MKSKLNAADRIATFGSILSWRKFSRVKKEFINHMKITINIHLLLLISHLKLYEICFMWD